MKGPLKQYRVRIRNSIFGILFIALTILVGIFIVSYISYFSDNLIPNNRAELGQLGDYFGGLLNPVFGFLSFAALLITIFYQSKELKLSRTELELTRKELASSASALNAQNKSIELQSFEQTFFSWLNNYRTLLESVSVQKTKNNVPYTINGRSALLSIWNSEFNLNFFDLLASNNHTQPDANEIQKRWDSIYNKNQYQLDSVFRTIFKLIDWIDSVSDQKLTKEQKWTYISIARSQLSWIELVFLYCNGLTSRGKKFKALAERYALFDNLEFNEVNIESLYISITYPDGYAEEAYSSAHAKRKLGIEA